MIKLDVNGSKREVDVDPATPLLYVLRGELDLNGAKYGCGLGQCGACTVLVDGESVFSCLTPVLVLEGRRIVTIEGIGTLGDPAPLQQAFITEQAAQCGYCSAGMIMRAASLLRKNPDPSIDEIKAHMNTNLCRCGTHLRIIQAVRRAASRARAAVLMPRATEARR